MSILHPPQRPVLDPDEEVRALAYMSSRLRDLLTVQPDLTVANLVMLLELERSGIE